MKRSDVVPYGLAGRSPGSPHGFTLLEVLVSLVIVGTTITSMFVLLSTTIRNTRKIEAANRAISLGHSKLNELLIVTQPESGHSSGEYLVPDQLIKGFWDEFTRWEAYSSEYRSDGSGLERAIYPLQVQFVVYWKANAGGAESQLRLETIRLSRRSSQSLGREQ